MTKENIKLFKCAEQAGWLTSVKKLLIRLSLELLVY